MAAFEMVYRSDLDHKGCAQFLEPQWFIADRSFGSAKIAAQTMNYVLKEAKGGEELQHIFKLASSSLADFRYQLDAWLLARSEMRAVTLSELKGFLAQNSSVDFKIFDSPEDEARGFISHKAYTFAIAHGLFPIGDPHDLFFHIPAFLDPRFADSLKRIAKLIFETSGRSEYQMLSIYLCGVARAIGVENWSYLIAEPSTNQPYLFLQGKKPFFEINDLTTPVNIRKNLISSFVNVENKDYSVYDFKYFPKWQIFSKQESDAKILRKLVPILNSIEISRNHAKSAEKRFRDELGDSIEVDEFLPRLADFINRDPLLKRAYTSKIRGQSARLLLDLLEDYWRWIQRVSEKAP